MRQSCLLVKCVLAFTLVGSLGAASTADASDFTIGLKAWNASFSSTGFESGDDLFFPGLYFSAGITERIWISAGYVEGEVDTGIDIAGTVVPATIEEVDSDIIVGWSFPKLDVGIGYRYSKFTTTVGGTSAPAKSTGPMVFLGGGDLFGQSRWGYYWGAAYMFLDLDDDGFGSVGENEHFNGEAGLRWTSQKNLSILFGYRYKEYFGSAPFSFDGPVVNLAYTWR